MFDKTHGLRFYKNHICFSLPVLKKTNTLHLYSMCGGIKTLKHNVRTTLKVAYHDCVATSPVVLHWLQLYDSSRTGLCAKNKNICMWREQAIIEWSRLVISIVASCHGAKLCAHAARDFQSQHHKSTTLPSEETSLADLHPLTLFLMYLFSLDIGLRGKMFSEGSFAIVFLRRPLYLVSRTSCTRHHVEV